MSPGPPDQLHTAASRAMPMLRDGIRARGVIQTLYADLDLTNFPIAVPEILPLFTQIGLTDSDLRPKPALGVWDGLFARRLG